MKILSSHYLPCLQWFQVFLNNDDCVIDMHEHFVKQTYRNRFCVLAANGKLALSIPVKKVMHHTAMYDIGIENEFNWQHQHWQAIVSAYNNSPYFLHYKNRFEKLFATPFTNLLQWNDALLKVCLVAMKVEKPIVYSTQYIQSMNEDVDYRLSIHPKKVIENDFKPYLQVFCDKFPFEPNLSIIDLLFNYGPRWKEFL